MATFAVIIKRSSIMRVNKPSTTLESNFYVIKIHLCLLQVYKLQLFWTSATVYNALQTYNSIVIK